ncbi:MAG: hypothetical protein IIA87_05455 [Nanoarchaeota archaeon]|nr:hypothetical protein [Nanoarchaeota archaeon]
MGRIRNTLLAGTVGLAGVLGGCEKDVIKGTYTFTPEEQRLVTHQDDERGYLDNVTVKVEAWQNALGRHLLIYDPTKKAEHIEATDSTEFNDTRLWEEIRPIALSGNSPLHYLSTPERLEEIWNSVYVKETGERE